MAIQSSHTFTTGRSFYDAETNVVVEREFMREKPLDISIKEALHINGDTGAVTRLAEVGVQSLLQSDDLVARLKHAAESVMGDFPIAGGLARAIEKWGADHPGVKPYVEAKAAYDAQAFTFDALHKSLHAGITLGHESQHQATDENPNRALPDQSGKGGKVLGA